VWLGLPNQRRCGSHHSGDPRRPLTLLVEKRRHRGSVQEREDAEAPQDGDRSAAGSRRGQYRAVRRVAGIRLSLWPSSRTITPARQGQFSLSLRDVELLLAERGVMLSFSVWYVNQGFGRIQSLPAFDAKTFEAAVKQAGG
jgi:hypothetical protein